MKKITVILISLIFIMSCNEKSSISGNTIKINGLEIKITVEVHTVYKTGVEVEAMHGVMITALTMYDMLKPIDKHIEILNIQLEELRNDFTILKERMRTLYSGQEVFQGNGRCKN